MKAIQAADHGGYDALRLVDIPQPQPRAGQALVRVTSAGVTPLDRTVLAGLHPRVAAPPLVPGNEGAGVVIDESSGHFSAGERALFFAGPGGVAQDGTFAEIASVPSGNLAPLPGEIPDEIAGGLPERVSGASPPRTKSAIKGGLKKRSRASRCSSEWPVRRGLTATWPDSGWRAYRSLGEHSPCLARPLSVMSPTDVVRCRPAARLALGVAAGCWFLSMM